MAEAVDPNLVKAATTDFSWIPNGIKNGMEFAQARAELDYKKDALQEARGQTEQQRALLDFQKSQLILGDLEEILQAPSGPYRKQKIKSMASKGMAVGYQVSPEFMAMLEDDAGAQEISTALNTFNSLGPLDKAKGLPELTAVLGTDKAWTALKNFNSITKDQQQAQQADAELQLRKTESERLGTMSQAQIDNMKATQQQNKDELAWKKQNDLLDHQIDLAKLEQEKKDKATKMGPVAEAFVKPIRDLEIKQRTGTAALKQALDNFRKIPSTATRQGLAVAMARNAGDNRVSNMDIKAYNLSNLGQTGSELSAWISSNPNEAISGTTFNNLVALADHTVKTSAQRNVQAVGDVFRTQVSAHPELITEGHPVVKEYERKLGVRAVLDPEKGVILVPNRPTPGANPGAAPKGPPMGEKRSAEELGAIMNAMRKNWTLDMINKRLGGLGKKTMSQAEYDKMKKNAGGK